MWKTDSSLFQTIMIVYLLLFVYLLIFDAKNPPFLNARSIKKIIFY